MAKTTSLAITACIKIASPSPNLKKRIKFQLLKIIFFILLNLLFKITGCHMVKA